MTYWLRAGVPTSGAPSGVTPTNEGMISSPSTVRTCTLPSTSAATSEFVVPRSMPTITSAIGASSVWRRGARDPDLGEAEHPAIGEVARAEHLEDRPRGRCRRVRHVHGAHYFRVEGLALGRDLVHVEPPQRVVEPVEGQAVALDERLQHGALPEASAEPAKTSELAPRFGQTSREAIASLQELDHQLQPGLAPGLGEPPRDGVLAAGLLEQAGQRGSELGVETVGGPALELHLAGQRGELGQHREEIGHALGL